MGLHLIIPLECAINNRKHLLSHLFLVEAFFYELFVDSHRKSIPKCKDAFQYKMYHNPPSTFNRSMFYYFAPADGIIITGPPGSRFQLCLRKHC
jgi:hypothetical protein